MQCNSLYCTFLSFLDFDKLSVWASQVIQWQRVLSSGERNGNPLQYSCLGNCMDKGAWWTVRHDSANEQQQSYRCLLPCHSESKQRQWIKIEESSLWNSGSNKIGRGYIASAWTLNRKTEIWNMNTNKTDTHIGKGRFIKENGQVITEAKKYHNLPSASWRFRKAGGNIQSEFKGLSKGGQWYKFWSESESLKTGEPVFEGPRRWTSQTQAEGIHPFSASLFYSNPRQIGWYPVTLSREIFFHSVYWTKG